MVVGLPGYIEQGMIWRDSVRSRAQTIFVVDMTCVPVKLLYLDSLHMWIFALPFIQLRKHLISKSYIHGASELSKWTLNILEPGDLFQVLSAWATWICIACIAALVAEKERGSCEVTICVGLMDCRVAWLSPFGCKAIHWLFSDCQNGEWICKIG